MSFRYVIAINLLIAFIIGCQGAKGETFELPQVRKKFITKVSIEKAEYDGDTKSYHQQFDFENSNYSVTWSATRKLIAESVTYADLSEVFTYQNGKLSMKAKMKRYAFDPYYREKVNLKEETEDSIFYYLK
ncbi:hypothetical protein EHQ52_14875 [Leptospira koniambonensis]|uniref:Uncharacterized protein n=1 Tax=Leptospira koniambonensis TaxID=2484950 RepID=A0A4R9J4C3_9LEPT|nr:hypothetical protein [Leptospira koniambonensis]TGL32563.1 hypothetical protein EHQ52_14875 [Leptospira koniambonensis]